MPKRLHNQRVFLKRRKDLRNSATAPEVILWQHLKNKGLGYKFRRQHSVGPYILDFYCPKLRLAIELDGKLHNQTDSKIYDSERTKFLESLDIKVIRFKNIEVVKKMKEVLKKILSNTPLR